MSFHQNRVDKYQIRLHSVYLPLTPHTDNSKSMKNSILTAIGFALCTVAATAQVQPVNASFENWENISGTIGNNYNEPIDWNTGNQCSEILNQLAVTQSADAVDGASSARLETLPAFGNIRINGVVTTANMVCLANGGGQEGGTSFTTELPDSVVGYFKYTPANNDSAYCQLMFLANNDADTISYTRYNFTETVTQWTRFSFPVTIPTGSTTPEKLSLFFSSSWGDGSAGQAEVGSLFFIDGIEFVYSSNSVAEYYNAAEWQLYPNPANDVVTINGNEKDGAIIRIYDITGKEVKTEQLESTTVTLSVSDLVEGLYVYQISSLEGAMLRTGKLMVNH